jgi:Protein of unknown function (DUF1573)
MLRYSFVVLAGMLSAGSVFAGSWADGMFDEFSKDFGSVPRGPVLKHSFAIKNNTGKVVTVSGVRVSCNLCTSAVVNKGQLQPGEETAVVVSMDSSKFIGSKTVYVYVTFSQPEFQEVKMWVQANSRDDVTVSPDNLGFGKIKRGSSPTLTTTVTLYGAAGSQITEVEPESTFVQAKVEKIEGGSGVAYKVSTSLRADVPVGKWFTDVWVKTNNPSMPRVRVPLTVEVESALSVSPPSVALGQVKMGETVERKVMVRGTTPFKIKQIKGADANLEVTDASDEAKLVHVLTVKVKASKAGDLNRTLKVITDLKEDNEVEFSARGSVEQ